MIHVTGQMQSAEWSVTQNQSLCEISACVMAESPAADDFISAGIAELSKGICLAAENAAEQIKYTVNETGRNFSRICLTVSCMVKKTVRHIRKNFAVLCRRTAFRKSMANFKFTMIQRL